MEARDKDGPLLVEIAGSSLSQRAFLETIAQVYGARPKVATQLVVLLTQRAIDAFEPSVWQAIRDMHAYGFRFALDGIEHMRTDFAALAVAGFRFIRLPSQVLLDGFTAPERFVAADEIYQRATLAGLSIVASGIADAKTQKRLLEIGVDLGQGALFGVPRQVMLTGPSNQSAAA
jgi:cyclic-di-GMP phosphodiesterase TipF (flagellum assembly factor)